MNYLDIFFILFFAFAVIKGLSKGFIIELFSLVGFFLGIFFAIKLTSPITSHFFDRSEYLGLISIAIFIIIFIAFSIAVNLIARLLKKAINFTILGLPDKILGSVFAVLKWGLFASVLIWILESIGVAIPGDVHKDSLIFPFVAGFAPSVFNFLSSYFPWFLDIFDFMDSFHQKEKLV